MESARVIAGLTRIVRDVSVAEELAHGALLVALEKWPESGIPENPGAWLMATAKHRASISFAAGHYSSVSTKISAARWPSARCRCQTPLLH